jgi:hypothetical protein
LDFYPCDMSRILHMQIYYRKVFIFYVKLLSSFNSFCGESFVEPKLSDSNAKIGTMVRTMRARINRALTQQVEQPILMAGLTPIRSGCRFMEIALFRWK